jgi:prepilin-type N-terminal cleavage/methylation domain-containing protein
MSPHLERRPDACPAAGPRQNGFSLIEVLVATAIMGIITVFVLAIFTQALGVTGRSNERSVATTLGTQLMEQIRASLNPVDMVGIVSLPRTALPLAWPYDGLRNPMPYQFEVAVTLLPNTDLTITTATVDVFRPARAQPLVTLTTILDDQ